MIGPIIFLAIWLFMGYWAAGASYASFEKQFQAGKKHYGLSWLLFLAGICSVGVLCATRGHGVCWNWITKPDLSAPPEPEWPLPQRAGSNYPCLKCGKNTTDYPQGEPLCYIHTPEYHHAGGVGMKGCKKAHTEAMKKVMGPNYVPPNPQNGQLAASQKEYCSVCGLSSSYVRSGICMTCIARNVRPSDLATRSGSLPTSQISEPIVAYRVWNLDRATMQLKSCTQDYLWPLRKKICRDVFNNKGIHAVKHLSRLQDGTGQGLWGEYVADVAGEVYLWGEVTEYQLGYKAEFAYPKSLWVPEDTDPMVVMKLEENYGVPVEMRKEFKKLVRSTYNDYANFAFPPNSGLFTYKCQKCGTYYPTATCPTCAAQLLPATPVHSCSFCGHVLDSSLSCINPTCVGSVNYNQAVVDIYKIAGSWQYGTPFIPAPNIQLKPGAIVPYDPTAGAGPKP